MDWMCGSSPKLKPQSPPPPTKKISGKFIYFLNIGIEPWASCMLDRCSTTELHFHTFLFFILRQESHHVAQADLKFVLFLPQLPQ
jgi:hypothetical protein